MDGLPFKALPNLRRLGYGCSICKSNLIVCSSTLSYIITSSWWDGKVKWKNVQNNLLWQNVSNGKFHRCGTKTVLHQGKATISGSSIVLWLNFAIWESKVKRKTGLWLANHKEVHYPPFTLKMIFAQFVKMLGAINMTSLPWMIKLHRETSLMIVKPFSMVL